MGKWMTVIGNLFQKIKYQREQLKFLLYGKCNASMIWSWMKSWCIKHIWICMVVSKSFVLTILKCLPLSWLGWPFISCWFLQYYTFGPWDKLVFWHGMDVLRVMSWSLLIIEIKICRKLIFSILFLMSVYLWGRKWFLLLMLIMKFFWALTHTWLMKL